MKRTIVLSILFVGVLALAFSVSQFVYGKAHVPPHKEQVCHGGQVLEVGAAAKAAHLAHGDGDVPKNDFCCIYLQGESCDVSNLCPHTPDHPMCNSD